VEFNFYFGKSWQMRPGAMFDGNPSFF